MKLSVNLLRRAGSIAVIGLVLALCVGLVVVTTTMDFASDEPADQPAGAASSSPAASPSQGSTAATPSPSPKAAGTGGQRDAKPRGDRPKPVKKQRAGGRVVPDDLVAEVEDLLAAQLDDEPAQFRVASFNVLGHSHTTARGNKPGYADGNRRMAWTVRLLRAADVDVVGFQEFEIPQFRAFQRLTGRGFGVFPGPKLGRNPVRNSIAWRRDTWDLVRADTIPIPYFRGHRVPMPYVLLQHRDSGRGVYFINIHNPTSNKKRGNNERWRDLGTRLQVNLMRRLQNRTGLPVVLTGDFNERVEAFCTVTGGGVAQAANGGSVGRPCRPPAEVGIDWIFGTTDIEFTGYVRNNGGLVRRASDHPLLVAQAEVG